MSKLRAPLKELLDQPLPERSVQRLWRAVNTPRRPSARTRLRWAGLGALSAFALSALSWWLIDARSLGREVPALSAMRGPERGLSAGTSLGETARDTEIALSDGSRLALQRGAELRVVDNAAGHFGTQLQRGRVVFDVKPGGPRQWHIDCGAAAVDVIGTQFVITRDERGVSVAVSRGVVSVKSNLQPQAARRLTAGQRWFIAAQPEGGGPLAGGPQPTAAEAGLGEARADAGAADGHARAVETPLSAAAEREGRMGRELDALLNEADAARRARHNERAYGALERAVRLAPNSPHALLAALTLARAVTQDDPARAVRVLMLVRNSTGAPGWLREDALARLVEAHAHAGQKTLAGKAAAAYRHEYPTGRWTTDVQRWAALP